MRQLYDRTAERVLLGAMMLSPVAQDAARSTMVPEDFALAGHQALFRVICDIRHKGASDVDMPAITTALGPKGLADIGGPDTLLDLEFECVSAANHQHFIDKVLEFSYLRKARDWARSVARTVDDEGATAGDVRALAGNPPSSGFLGRQPLIHISDVDAEGADLGVPTGYADLDKGISTGGYPAGQMTVVRAYHKGGKSTFMLSSWAEAARAGRRVLYATFADLTSKQIRRRVNRNETGWSHRPRNLMSGIEYDAFEEVMARDWSAYLFDGSTMEDGADAETFAAWLKAHHRAKPFDLVFLDYAQKIRSRDRRQMTRVEEAEECSDLISKLARRLELPIVVGSQITMGTGEGKAVTKGSRAWEEDAGWVLSLQKEAPDPQGNANVKCEINYSRFGEQDKETYLRWNAERLRIEAAV